MKRDGANISIWQHGMSSYETESKGLPAGILDVAIIGGGITGLATALNLQMNGKKCILIESHSIGFGTTGGTTAHLNTAFETPYYKIENSFGEDKAKLLYKAAEEAVGLIENYIREFNIECDFEYKDACLFSKNRKQSEELDRIIGSSQKAGLGISYIGNNFIDVPFEKAAIIKKQAQFHPAKYIYGLAKAFEAKGGLLIQDCMMESFEDSPIVSLKTSLGKFQARQVVFATHIPPGINLLHFRCAPYRSYVLAVKLRNNNYPEGLVYDMDDPYHYYRTQFTDGERYLIFGGEDHKTGHDENVSRRFESLEKNLGEYFDIGKVAFKWSSQYYEPADGLAYIGHFPGHARNIFAATGFGGNGMTYSHIAARTIGDIILSGQSSYQDLFDPDRIKPVAGFTNFVRENADVVKEFIGKNISKEKIKTLDEVRKGEGKVIKYEGNSIAVFRNDDGMLHAVDPVCTHAKCVVQWNETEISWDCPCHGARYSMDGDVLTGPSGRNLDKIDIS